MEDFLSDRSRTGTLVGSVIGGAVTAHPVGILLGSIGGYLVGKSSIYQKGAAVSSDTPAADEPSTSEMAPPSDTDKRGLAQSSEMVVSVNVSKCFSNKGGETDPPARLMGSFERIDEDVAGRLSSERLDKGGSRANRTRCFYMAE